MFLTFLVALGGIVCMIITLIAMNEEPRIEYYYILFIQGLCFASCVGRIIFLALTT